MCPLRQGRALRRLLSRRSRVNRRSEGTGPDKTLGFWRDGQLPQVRVVVFQAGEEPATALTQPLPAGC